jgi:plastocyanin
MGYSPQMAKQDIRKLYHRLAEDFATKPFDSVAAECDAIIKKYYSCLSLLLQMAILLVNHANMADNPERQLALLEQAIELCKRVRTESNDIAISKEATALESGFCLMANKPQSVLELLGESPVLYLGDSELIASAFQMMGNIQLIHTSANNNGYVPNFFIVEKGKQVNWVIWGDAVNSCNNEIVIPDLNISQKIKEGNNVITFTPEKEGELRFSCWMGMLDGVFIVVNDINKIPSNISTMPPDQVNCCTEPDS